MSKVYRVEGGNMFWLGCCPKCNGDLYEDRDHHGAYIACIQCGHYLYEAHTTRPRLGCNARFGTGLQAGEVARELVGTGEAA